MHTYIFHTSDSCKHGLRRCPLLHAAITRSSGHFEKGALRLKQTRVSPAFLTLHGSDQPLRISKAMPPSSVLLNEPSDEAS